MKNIFKSPEIQKNISENDLGLDNKKYIISEKVISNINELIKNKDEDKILQKLNILKELWRKQYFKANTLEEKEIIFRQIFINLEKLLNNTNYIEVYNSDSSVWKTWENYSDISILENMVSIWIEKNIEWANCNSWNLFILELINYITNNDENIENSFTLRKKDNHWMLYFTLNNKIFLYHLDKTHILKIKNNKVNKEYNIHFNNQEEYNKIRDIGSLNKKSQVYSIWNYYTKLHKKFWFLLMEVKLNDNKNKK